MDCELYEKLQYCIGQTSFPIETPCLESDDVAREPIRNILETLLNKNDLADFYKKDIKIAQQKIREANLILGEVRKLLDICPN